MNILISWWSLDVGNKKSWLIDPVGATKKTATLKISENGAKSYFRNCPNYPKWLARPETHAWNDWNTPLEIDNGRRLKLETYRELDSEWGTLTRLNLVGFRTVLHEETEIKVIFYYIYFWEIPKNNDLRWFQNLNTSGSSDSF